MPVPELGGAFYLRAATSKLSWKAKMATVMVGPGAHLGNVGLKGEIDDVPCALDRTGRGVGPLRIISGHGLGHSFTSAF